MLALDSLMHYSKSIKQIYILALKIKYSFRTYSYCSLHSTAKPKNKAWRGFYYSKVAHGCEMFLIITTATVIT